MRLGNLVAPSKCCFNAGDPAIELTQERKREERPHFRFAIEKGFLTLTETLLDGGADPSANGNTLSIAVRSKRIDIVRLLLDRSVPVSSVDFESVCYSCDPELIQLFLDRGADPITGYPIYRGFQNVLKPIIAVYKANIDKCRAAAASQHGALPLRQRGKPAMRQSPLMGRSAPRCKDP